MIKYMMKKLNVSLMRMTIFVFILLTVQHAQNISFSTDSVIATNSGNYALTCSDFNGDEMPDVALVTVNESVNDPVSIFLNDGAGKLIPTADSLHANSNDPRDIAAGDVNNDQIQDLAVSVYGDSTIVILLGTGDGTFTKDTVISVPSAPMALLLSDFDNDTNTDLAAITMGSLLTFKGDGHGRFNGPTILSETGRGRDIKAGDFNGDGYIDLINGTSNVHAVNLFLNDGAGNFPVRDGQPTYRPSWYVDIADFDGDGDLDIVAGSGSWEFDNVYLLLQESNGEFTAPDTLSPSSYVADVAAGDFNNDGNPDVMVADRHGIYILSGSGDGHFSQTDTIDYSVQTYQAKDVQIIDMDRDGRLDLVVARGDQISVYYNTGPFTSIDAKTIKPAEFALYQNYPNPFNPNTTIKFSLNKSGLVDLAIFNLLGQKVASLVSGYYAAGSHILSFDGSGLSSGIYFYRLKTENGCMYRKMQIIK